MHHLRKAVVIAIAACLSLTIAWADDEVERRSEKKEIRGTILSESATEVEIKTKSGATEKVPVNDLARVQYDGKVGLDVFQAESNERSGFYKEALEQYKKAEAGAGKGYPAAAIAFGQARCLAHIALASDAARVDEAIQAISAFLAKNPNSRHHYPAQDLLGQLYLKKGNADGAQKAFAELRKAPFPELKLKADTFGGRLLMSQGEFDKAIERFDQVAKAPAKTAAEKSRQQEATLAKAECLSALKKYAESEKLLRDVIAAAPPEEGLLQAAAFNALGDALRAANKPKDALLAYLYVDLIYPNQKSEQPRALAAMAQLWEELGYADRAEEARAKLKRDYADTPWAKQAGAPAPKGK